MIDSHCHLDHEPLFSNNLRDDILIKIKRSWNRKNFTICTTKDSFKNIIKIIELDPIIYGTFGIHPHEEWLLIKSITK